jgi:lysophospholipase L1-like esterase
MEKLISSSRPFQYIGDIDPSEPQPWPVDEKDWHALHETLVKRVQESDATSTNQVRDYLPQLIFYGDSITEGWSGTSFGHLPGPHRMWTAGEEEYIRDVFTNAFGDNSDWGKRALKPPLVLGISGSRTYDFIWRVVNGEFPVSSLLDNTGENKENNTNEVFPIEKLERIYILLMGTNNLGGGMLPKPTLKGMDTAGRTILQLHEKHFPNTPAALLFSELLPRKDDFRAVKMCPPRCKNFEKLEPYQSFMPAIKKVNQELPNMLNSWREDFQNSRIILLSANTKTNEVGETDQNDNKRYLYTPVITCGKEMFAFDDLNEFDVYLPDRLHPNAKGYELWSRCLKKGLGTIMTR